MPGLPHKMVINDIDEERAEWCLEQADIQDDRADSTDADSPATLASAISSRDYFVAKAQVHATLAVAAEVRKLTEKLGELL
jgi:hypothetical protein